MPHTKGLSWNRRHCHVSQLHLPSTWCHSENLAIERDLVQALASPCSYVAGPGQITEALPALLFLYL